jgi:acyl-CoA thioesterase-1
MPIASARAGSRREFLALGAAALVAPAFAKAAGRSLPVVTMLGDSITAGYGLSAAAALPARLSADLARLGTPAVVRAAGVSGDTTADGLARVDFSVRSDTSLCIVALGGNDLLQGLDPKVTQANLTAIVRRLKRRGIGILLVGIAAPAVIGAGYARAFNAVFPAVARAEGVPLYPDLLAGVEGHPGLVQGDGIHPDAAGAAVIAARLAPVVVRILRARGRR